MTETAFEEAQTLALHHNDFKTTVLNMVKELKENMDKQLKEIRKIPYESNEYINKRKKINKKE